LGLELEEAYGDIAEALESIDVEEWIEE